MERLEPFEKLECDYYLDDKGGWYSDCENNSSDRLSLFISFSFLFIAILANQISLKLLSIF